MYYVHLSTLKEWPIVHMDAGYLSEGMRVGGPFLVVVPLSTVPNWIKEFSRWMPQMNVIVYVGDSKSREVARAFEFPSQYGGTSLKFDVLITTYELVLKDAPILSRIRWQYLMVDEAHRFVLLYPHPCPSSSLLPWKRPAGLSSFIPISAPHPRFSLEEK